MPTYTHVVQFDEGELICRMHEAFSRSTRPAGMSPQEAIDCMEVEVRDGWLFVAKVVLEYVNEMMAQATRVQ